MQVLEIGFGNYRSIGSEPIWLDLTKKVNVLIGPNNSGKSNVLRALAHVRADGWRKAPEEINAHGRDRRKPPSVGLHLNFPDRCTAGGTPWGPIQFIWPCGNEAPDQEQAEALLAQFEQPGMSAQGLFQQVTGQSGSRGDADLCKRLATTLIAEATAEMMQIMVIPDVRKLDKGDEFKADGAGVVKTLAGWLTPNFGDEADEEKAEKITDFLRRLLKEDDLVLEVPPGKPEILVRRNKMRLPLTSHGCGIHELIILAITIFSKENHIICIEEPEVHLHPRLQKEFLRFLESDETSNQFVITTHSHALMCPSDKTNVVRIWQEDGVTKGQKVETTAHSLRTLADLGVAASDLLQANYVIWVEGPSDRVYLNRWLALLAPELREGIEYAIMFYGGRCLANLTFAEDDPKLADDLVSLLRINQHSAIVIDSDRAKPRQHINKTKQRIREECGKDGRLCWITDGREIENYLPAALLEAIFAKSANLVKPLRFGQYDKLEQALQRMKTKGGKPSRFYEHAKVTKAREMAAAFGKGNFSKELAQQMEVLLADIRRAQA